MRKLAPGSAHAQARRTLGATLRPMHLLIHKHVVLGLSGGIACYKAAELCRALVKAGASVQVVMTEAAAQFITRRLGAEVLRYAADPFITGIYAGDPATLIADSTRIQKELGWQPEFGDLRQIIQTAWNWHQSHPHGYASK